MNSKTTRTTFAFATVALAVATLAACGSSAKTSATVTSTTGGSTTTSAPATSTTARGSTTTTAAPAGATTTTVATTPTTPATGSSPALTATFVSSAQGFVLEQNGTLAATTDGGHTWHRVGSLTSHGPDEVIRYIDPTDGFAFARGSGPLLITHDAGATWTQVSTPFTSVADLAIGHGMIYVVAFHSASPTSFQIWSTPVEHLVWKLDSLALATGGGPVPMQQIVLNAGKGWILNEDRTVVSGAQLASNGSWDKWNPPCLTVEGPAYLSASTGTDLVASCDEHLWGGTTGQKVTPAVYFSHNSGSTLFTRNVAPVFGPVLSPSAQTAVVVGDTTMQRTTDGGSTWTAVAHFSQAAATDWGFTSSTQGFVITGGRMLMTYDAGATWQQMTLP